MESNVNLNRQQASEAFTQFASLPIPQFFFNGFTSNVTHVDISSVLTFGPRPLAILTMTPVMAKTYGQALLALVAEYESETGQIIKTVNELSVATPKGSSNE